MKKLESHNTALEFESTSRLDPGLRADGVDALGELKEKRLQETACGRSANLTSLRRAADDAASLAWMTPFPLLVLPELFFEKAAEACVRSQRQRQIWQRSLGLAGQE